jgi:type IX secretion system PorP/SprF family membrane protein
MKKSIFTISTFFALASGVVNAQQEKLLTHFIYDKMSINPGSTGMLQGISGTMIYRNQWDKVNGAPNSVLFNGEANLDRVFHGGAGISFYHDAIGEMRQNNLLLNYSFPVRFQSLGTLGIGIGLGLVNVGFNPAWIPPQTINDPLLPIATGGSNMDLNFGLFWQGDKPYYVGFSMTHLTQADIKNVNYTNARHMFLMGGYTMENVFGAGKSIDAQALMRTDMVKYSAELNVRYLHSLDLIKGSQVYAGVTGRISDGVGLMLGYQPNAAMTIGYSYDITMNKLSSISRGSHEFVLRYIKMIPPPPVQKSKHPRWL